MISLVRLVCKLKNKVTKTWTFVNDTCKPSQAHHSIHELRKTPGHSSFWPCSATTLSPGLIMFISCRKDPKRTYPMAMKHGYMATCSWEFSLPWMFHWANHRTKNELSGNFQCHVWRVMKHTDISIIERFYYFYIQKSNPHHTSKSSRYNPDHTLDPFKLDHESYVIGCAALAFVNALAITESVPWNDAVRIGTTWERCTFLSSTKSHIRGIECDGIVMYCV